jgi:hypothetical protein
MNPDGTVNWEFVWATLIIRFIGVFVILGTLWLAVAVMTKVVAKTVEIKNKKNA